ncbi:glycosyltransferase family 39 protein [Candidatus Microgenomates bacterium]|nr:glycosyltransferase family 39 protein [Candidatus Microgenomates bacterium]
MNFAKKIYLLLISLIGVHVLILSSLQFTAWPEMLSFPYMINNGFTIYKDFHHVYQPLLTFILLGVYKIFGFNLLTLKFFTFTLIVLIDLMIFLNLKKLTKKNLLSLSVLALYVFLQPIFDGNMLWYDVAVILPILVSVYFLKSNLFMSGLFVAISFLVKQQAVLIGLPMFIYLLVTKTKKKDVLSFIYGCALPVLVLATMLQAAKLFPDYLFWTFEFPLLHLPKIPGYAILPNSREIKIFAVVAATLLAGFALNYKKLNEDPVKVKFYLLLSILFFLVLSAFPRFSLFHLQPALAVFVILLGVLMSFNRKFFIVLIIPIFFLWKNVLVSSNFEDRFYGAGEKQFASELKSRSIGEKVYLLGPNSVEYVMSGTIPPKPWIENYVWHFEIPGVQEKMIDGWKIDPPIYIYWSKPKSGNWHDLATYQPQKIVKYINTNYIKIDEIDNVEIWKVVKI